MANSAQVQERVVSIFATASLAWNAYLAWCLVSWYRYGVDKPIRIPLVPDVVIILALSLALCGSTGLLLTKKGRFGVRVAIAVAALICPHSVIMVVA